MENYLPAEVAQIAQNVSVEKRNEVQSVLNHVFNGVSKMREQIDMITVESPEDNVNMKLANTIRLGVRRVRLDAEKTFDTKRAEVQQQMLSYKTEDQLWLKAKQTMQILTKEIEETARWKEETRERYEAEQRELKVQQRIVKVAAVAPEINRTEFENMADETFDRFFAGLEKAYNDRIEAERKAEEERIAKEKAEAAERERIRQENEKLRKEAEDAEAARKKIEEAARKEREEAERKLKAEQESARIAAEKAKAEREAIEEKARKERAKLEAELKAKKDAEILAAKLEAEQKRKAEAAPDKQKLIDFAAMIDGIELPKLQTADAGEIAKNVKILLGKVSVYIVDKSNNL